MAANEPPERADLQAWIDSGARMLRLPVSGANRDEVLANLERFAAVAAQLDAVEIDASVEPLTVFVR
jgi:hypothetical protein